MSQAACLFKLIAFCASDSFTDSFADFLEEYAKVDAAAAAAA